jgi:hypothetical protein
MLSPVHGNLRRVQAEFPLIRVVQISRASSLYELIPTMPEVRLLPLIERFTTMLAELPVFVDTFGAI